MCLVAVAVTGTPSVAAQADDYRTCARASGEVAISACTRAIASRGSKGRDLARLFYNRGVEYSRKSDLDRAIADFSEAIRLDPKDAATYNGRGLAYEAKGETDRAI